MASYRPPTIGEILALVCRECDVRPDQVLGSGRHKRVAIARGITCLIARRMTALSWPEIARGIGRKNHSTALSASARIQCLLDSPPPRWDWGNGSKWPTIGHMVEAISHHIIEYCTEATGGMDAIGYSSAGPYELDLSNIPDPEGHP